LDVVLTITLSPPLNGLKADAALLGAAQQSGEFIVRTSSRFPGCFAMNVRESKGGQPYIKNMLIMYEDGGHGARFSTEVYTRGCH
jgi:hypothetical protein